MLSLSDLRALNLYQLHARIRPLTSPLYLGNGTCLCRILGRYKFYIHSDDVGFGAHILMDGAWELWISQFIARRVKRGQTVVDVGANYGYYSLLLADLVGPSGRVIAIEPNPNLGKLLANSISVNGFAARTTLHHLAATDRDDVILSLALVPNEPKNSHLTEVANHHLGVPVRGESLNSLLKNHGRVDFLKVDVEGAEEAVLDGAWGIIQAQRPEMVIEFNHHRCRDPQGLLDRLRALYGPIHHLNTPGRLIEIQDADLLDATRLEDWMIFVSREPPAAF